MCVFVQEVCTLTKGLAVKGTAVMSCEKGRVCVYLFEEVCMYVEEVCRGEDCC